MKPKFVLTEKLNLPAQFVDYNEHPILILEILKTDPRSLGWELSGVNLLVAEIKRDVSYFWIYKANLESLQHKRQRPGIFQGLTCHCASRQKV